MRTTRILLALAALLVSGCYAYEYVYYEPVPAAPATKTVTYVEHLDTTYVRYVEPPVVYVRYYDPWWYTPTPVVWSVWCNLCFCYHNHYYDCPKYHRSYRGSTISYSNPPKTYSRDTSRRYHYDRVSSPPRRSTHIERQERTPGQRTPSQRTPGQRTLK
jgi:hypothetical protein